MTIQQLYDKLIKLNQTEFRSFLNMSVVEYNHTFINGIISVKIGDERIGIYIDNIPQMSYTIRTHFDVYYIHMPSHGYIKSITRIDMDIILRKVKIIGIFV